MTDPDDEHEFEAFLKRRTLLPNAVPPDDKLEPPVALDAIVLQQARDSIPAHKPSPKAPRWALPVALAATILLCLSVVMNISLNTHRPTAESTAPAPMAAESTVANSRGQTDRREIVAGDIPSGEVLLPEAKLAAPRAVAPPPVVAEAAAPRQTANEPARAADSEVDNAPARRRSDPKTWLQQIDALRAAGKTAQADAELRRFRAAFPAYATKPVPPASFEPPK